MTNKIGYVWHLRRLMADRGMFATTELVPLLAERGIGLSREQVYRLVTRTPERLNLTVLVALCDILELPGRGPDRATGRGGEEHHDVGGPAGGAAAASPPRPDTARARRIGRGAGHGRPAPLRGRAPDARAAVPGPARPAGESRSSPG